MKTLSIDTDNKIVFDPDVPGLADLAKDYKRLKSDTKLKYVWKYLGGRVGFVGSGTANYEVTTPDGKVFHLHIDRYANGKGFWGTNHSLEITNEKLTG